MLCPMTGLGNTQTRVRFVSFWRRAAEEHTRTQAAAPCHTEHAQHDDDDTQHTHDTDPSSKHSTQLTDAKHDKDEATNSSAPHTHSQFEIIAAPDTALLSNPWLGKTKSTPARHPMFDGMPFENTAEPDEDDDDDVDMAPTPAANPWAQWHRQCQHYMKAQAQAAQAPPSLPPPAKTQTQLVLTADAETGGYKSVAASSVSSGAATIPAMACEQQQLRLAMATANLSKQRYLSPQTGQYFDVISSAPGSSTPAPKKKKRKKKKKGVGSCVKWLYLISDAERECYGSLCRGQLDAVTLRKWRTALYEEAEWGHAAKDRSRGQGDGPGADHIAWYTEAGCSCSLADEAQAQEVAGRGFPGWLLHMRDTLTKLCACDKTPPNCAELFYLPNRAARWNWHSYCEHELFGLAGHGHEHKGKKQQKQQLCGQTVHLLLGSRRQFRFAPRKTKAIPGDEEKSVFLENGDLFVTCGKFSEDYVVKIDCEEEQQGREEEAKAAHTSMYIVWRWIVGHGSSCAKSRLQV